MLRGYSEDESHKSTPARPRSSRPVLMPLKRSRKGYRRTKRKSSTPPSENEPLIGPDEGTIARSSSTARKLGFWSEQSKDYVEWVAVLKEEFNTHQHPEIIEGPKALKDKGLEKVWQDAVAAPMAEEPHFSKRRFSNQREMIDAANKLLRSQAKKGPSPSDHH